MRGDGLWLEVTDRAGRVVRFELGHPLSAARPVDWRRREAAGTAFGLPRPVARTIAGPTPDGGCQVTWLECCPHGLTHLETPAHLGPLDDPPPTVADLPPGLTAGLMRLLECPPGPVIRSEHLLPALTEERLPIRLLGLRTVVSDLPPDTDFTGRAGVPVLDPAAAAALAAYRFQPVAGPAAPLDLLLVDLPSLDPEQDGGALAAHRAVFHPPRHGSGGAAADRGLAAVVELAWFGSAAAGLYWAVLTPLPWHTEAVPVGLWLYPLRESGAPGPDPAGGTGPRGGRL